MWLSPSIIGCLHKISKPHTTDHGRLTEFPFVLYEPVIEVWIFPRYALVDFGLIERTIDAATYNETFVERTLLLLDVSELNVVFHVFVSPL